MCSRIRHHRMAHTLYCCAVKRTHVRSECRLMRSLMMSLLMMRLLMMRLLMMRSLNPMCCPCPCREPQPHPQPCGTGAHIAWFHGTLTLTLTLTRNPVAQVHTCHGSLTLTLTLTLMAQVHTWHGSTAHGAAGPGGGAPIAPLTNASAFGKPASHYIDWNRSLNAECTVLCMATFRKTGAHPFRCQSSIA
jgi:hypothetical protein